MSILKELNRLRQQQSIVTDPVIAIGNLEMWLHGDDLIGTSDGDTLSDWGARVANVTFSAYQTAPQLDLTGAIKSARFSGTGGFSASEFAGIDFVSGSDSFSIVVMLGNGGSHTGTGTLVGKAENGAAPMHYQFQTNPQVTNGTGINLFRAASETTSSDHFFNISHSVARSDLDILTMTYDGTQKGVKVYHNTTQGFLQVDPTIGIGTLLNGNEDLYIGVRGNGVGGVGYPYTGTIRHVLIYSKELTTSDVGTLNTHLT